MFFEAELLIDPSDVTDLEAPPRPRLRRLLDMLTGGWREATSDQELLVGAVLLHCLQGGLEAAGVDDMVRVYRDGALLYHDQRGQPADLKVAIEQVQPPGRGYDELRMVLQHQDEQLSYVIDLHVCRVYPEDGIPIRGLVHGFVRDLDARAMAMGRGQDLLGALTDAMRGRLPHRSTFDGKGAVPPAFSQTVASLADALRRALPGARISHHERPVFMLPRQRWTDPSQLPGREEADALAPFSGDPGFREMTFYAHLLAPLCRAQDLSLEHVLFVDEAGRPIFRVGDEPLVAGRLRALEPGQPLDVMPSLDVVVFTGHDRDAETRKNGLVPEGTERAGLAARLALRAHEQRTLSGYVPVTAKRARASAGRTLGNQVRGASDWDSYFVVVEGMH